MQRLLFKFNPSIIVAILTSVAVQAQESAPVTYFQILRSGLSELVDALLMPGSPVQILAIAGAIGVVIIYYLRMRDTAGNNVRRARNHHKKGVEHHEKGNEEEASNYYTKANEFREKAEAQQ